MFVKPAPDPERPGKVLIVRDPLHMTPIPAEGRNVPDINYWHQRIRDKDLVLAEPPDDKEIPPVSAANEAATETGDHAAEAAVKE